MTEEQRSHRPIFIATLRAARLLAGCFVAHRSKTTAGILPLRFAHPAKIPSSATTPVTDLVHYAEPAGNSATLARSITKAVPRRTLNRRKQRGTKGIRLVFQTGLGYQRENRDSAGNGPAGGTSEQSRHYRRFEEGLNRRKQRERRGSGWLFRRAWGPAGKSRWRGQRSGWGNL